MCVWLTLDEFLRGMGHMDHWLGVKEGDFCLASLIAVGLCLVAEICLSL